MTAHSAPARPARAFAVLSFAIMVSGWIAFAAAVAVDPVALDDVWATVRDLPLVLELLAWLVGFPFLLGLAIWESSWAEAVRYGGVVAVALAYTAMFIPRR